MRRVLAAAAVILSCACENVLSQPPRRASAIQRVTGILHPRHALEPLDSVLAIRVYDARGAALAGVPVRWSLPSQAEGAALRVINGTTDSVGVSRAELRPGRTADAQRVIADVRNVGRIEFAVTIPAASIRVVPQHSTVWSGDDTVVAAELRDARGTLLSGGTVSWAAMDTSIVRVSSHSSPRSTVHGVAAGTARLVAWIGDGRLRALGLVTVRPVIMGHFITADARTLPDIRLEVSAAGRRDSVAVGDGRFTAKFIVPAEDAVILHASPADTAYHDVAVRVDDQRDLEGLVIALVPRWFRIEAGSFEGRVVRIDAAVAMSRVGGSAPFWRLVPYSGTGPRKLLGWRESDLPLRIAFGRDRSSEIISVADSIAFWEIARRMERDVGRSLFVPAESSDTTPANVVRVEIRSQGAEGHTFVAWGQSGDASEGILRFRRAAILRDPHVVTHELVHLLGFGHSNGWATVALPSGGTHAGLTPDDVGYLQLAMKLRRLQERMGALPGLPVVAPPPR